MFDSPPSPSWSPTLLPSHRREQGGGTGELARRVLAQVRSVRSEASPPRALGRRLVNVAPAVMASR
ncbi:hypothetical protein NQZ68_002423 [Dissostichus eleginoides]|nr:hypothetical protein NQZ68_002423 [Dissostichus eleginoides]